MECNTLNSSTFSSKILFLLHHRLPLLNENAFTPQLKDMYHKICLKALDVKNAGK